MGERQPPSVERQPASVDRKAGQSIVEETSAVAKEGVAFSEVMISAAS